MLDPLLSGRLLGEMLYSLTDEQLVKMEAKVTELAKSSMSILSPDGSTPQDMFLSAIALFRLAACYLDTLEGLGVLQIKEVDIGLPEPSRN